MVSYLYCYQLWLLIAAMMNKWFDYQRSYGSADANLADVY
jgi:hypothetical protein